MAVIAERTDSMPKTLIRKVALVTSGSRGIGAAIVRCLAREGAHVALTYASNPDRASETVKAAQALGVKALAVQADSADAKAGGRRGPDGKGAGRHRHFGQQRRSRRHREYRRLSPRRYGSHPGGECPRRFRCHPGRREAHAGGWADHLNGCVALDAKGFIRTGADLSHDDLAAAHWPLARRPHLLETSLPGVFAVGDVGGGNLKRVASAVGEESIAIALVHQVLHE